MKIPVLYVFEIDMPDHYQGPLNLSPDLMEQHVQIDHLRLERFVYPDDRGVVQEFKVYMLPENCTELTRILLHEVDDLIERQLHEQHAEGYDKGYWRGRIDALDDIECLFYGRRT